MIAFSCRQCGKRFDRPDNAAGTLVFCDCGTSNSVPFESTLAPLPEGAAPPARVPSIPALVPRWEQTGASSQEWEPRPQASWPSAPSFNPAYCLNHPTTPKQLECADCRLPFCGDCAVTLQGAGLCGPCKNHRLRTLQQGARVSIMAIFSPVIALLAGGLWSFVMLAAIGNQAEKSTLQMLGALGLLPQVIALTLGALSLHSIETDRTVGGREWAMTGLVAAVVSGTLMAVLGFLGHSVLE